MSAGRHGQPAAWRWVAAEAWPRRRALVFVFAAGAVPVLLNLPTLWLMRFTFDIAIPAKEITLIVASVAGMAACRLAYGALAYWATIVTAAELRKIAAGLRMSLATQLHLVNWARLPGLDNGSIQGRLVIDTERIETALHAAFNAAAPAVIPVIVFTIVMAWLSWPLTLALAIVAPLLHIPLLSMSKHVRSETATFQSAFERFNSGAGRLVRMLPMTKAHGTQTSVLSDFRFRVSDVAGAGAGMVGAHALFRQSSSAVTILAASIVLAGGGLAVASGTMSLGSLAAFTVAASIVGGAMARVAGSIPILIAGWEAMTRLSQAMDLVSAERENASGAVMPNHAGILTLRNVSVALAGRSILRDASLDIAPGKITAVAARNGQGKSTLIAVMLGLIRPSSGEVTLDGTPLAELDLDAYRAGAGVVPQAPILLKGSIRENICFGRNEVSQSALVRALQASGVDEMLTALGATIDTQIGEEGRMFSGGEGQRIAIARALVHSPKILFLDEPTNHLDDAGVTTLIANVFQPRKLASELRPTIVVATHDPRILAVADTVYDLAFGVASIRRNPPVKHAP